MLYLDSSTDKPDRIYLDNTLTDIVNQGIKIADTSGLMGYVSSERTKLLNDLRSNFGILNPNSAKQVSDAFKELAKAEFPIINNICIDEKTGKFSTNAENLAELKLLDVPIASLLSRYRMLNNIYSTINSINTMKDQNDLVHPTISYGKTGRINFSDPALLNINKKVLWNIIEPRDNDSVIYSIDIKNQEPWILINMLDIESLKAVRSENTGLYEGLFYRCFGRVPDKKERKEFKTAWNALTYGASKKLIMSRSKFIDGADIYDFFQTIDELKAYRKECTSKGYGNHKECKTVFGREMQCDGYRGMSLARQHMDYPIQGTGADILAFLNTNLDTMIDEYKLRGFVEPYMFRHDEIDIVVSKAILDVDGEESVLNFIHDTFEHCIDDWTPFIIEVSRVEPSTDFEKLLADDED